MKYEKPDFSEVEVSTTQNTVDSSGKEGASQCSASCCWGEGCWWA